MTLSGRLVLDTKAGAWHLTQAPLLMRGARLLLVAGLLLLAGLIGFGAASHLASGAGRSSSGLSAAEAAHAAIVNANARVRDDRVEHHFVVASESVEDLLDLQSEADPKPDPFAPAPPPHRRAGPEQSDQNGRACRASGRQGPNTGSLLALLALAAARARDGAARLGASA